MELRPGYKQTDAGVIPEDWETESVSNLASITTGARNTQDRIEDGLYPFFVRSSTVERINSYSFDGEAVLTAGDGVGTGKVFHYINGKFDFHQRVYKISDFSEKVSGKFFHSYFSTHFYKRIMSMTAKSSVDSVRMDVIANMILPLPTLAEQRAITAALVDMDTLTGALDQLIAKKRNIRQAAMQQLLTAPFAGGTRLSGFDGNWEVRSLAAICSMKSGEGITSANIDQFSKYPCYGGNGLRGFASRFTHHGSYALIGRQGALCGNVFSVEGQFFASEHAIVVTASANTDIRWLAYVLGRMNLNQYSESSAQPGLSVSKILKLDITAPLTKVEQSAIAEVLSEMDAELAALEQRRDKTRALKQGMMQELLTGRIRLV
jgi:type I restriction enzyme S subunit